MLPKYSSPIFLIPSIKYTSQQTNHFRRYHKNPPENLQLQQEPLPLSLQFPCGILPKKRIFWEDLGRTPEELPKKPPKI
ncbi:hypothetical protein BPO_0423 [Bergeyella porcorum]|uniref:Uncharacterized protein n=1 Tax=Bergeyella porcorum TaxID=1735111 RepID=A0AAU0F542_9FLAO